LALRRDLTPRRGNGSHAKTLKKDLTQRRQDAKV